MGRAESGKVRTPSISLLVPGGIFTPRWLGAPPRGWDRAAVRLEPATRQHPVVTSGERQQQLSRARPRHTDSISHGQHVPLTRGHVEDRAAAKGGATSGQTPVCPQRGASRTSATCLPPCTCILGSVPQSPRGRSPAPAGPCQLGRAALRQGMLSSFPQALNQRGCEMGRAWAGCSQAREQQLQVETGIGSLTQTAQPARQAGLRQEAH